MPFSYIKTLTHLYGDLILVRRGFSIFTFTHCIRSIFSEKLAKKGHLLLHKVESVV